MRGAFITIEGIEGVGKTTQILRMQRHLEAAGRSVVRTREPGGTDLAEAIRRLLLDDSGYEIPETSELLLMFAARAAHLALRIRPALEAGVWVLCDRFTDASHAYQGGGRGIPFDEIEQLKTLVHAETDPDLTLLLDADPAIGMTRIQSRDGLDRFENQPLEFFQRVRQHYLDLAKRYPQRIKLIDAAPRIDEVWLQISQALDTFSLDYK